MKLIIVTLYFALLFFSCEKSKKHRIVNNYSNFINIDNLPDTLYIGEDYIGKFKYESPLDTVSLDYGENRFIYLYITQELSENGESFSSTEEIEAVNHETFPSKDKDVYYSFNFKKTGNVRLSWLIDDKAFLYQKDSSMRILTNYYPFYKDLYIKDSSFIPKVSK